MIVVCIRFYSLATAAPKPAAAKPKPKPKPVVPVLSLEEQAIADVSRLNHELHELKCHIMCSS